MKNKKEYKLVIFDMDGLMFDTERYYCDANERVCQQYNIPINIKALYDVIGTSLMADETVLFPEEKSRELGNTLIYQAYMDALEEMCDKGVPIKKGLPELLDALENAGISKCVATSTEMDRTTRLLQASGFYERFAFVFSGHELKRGKPYPDVFLLTCEKAEIAPEDALILEDSSNGGLAARNALIDYIIIPDINDPIPEVAEHALFVGKDLFDVIKYLELN